MKHTNLPKAGLAGFMMLEVLVALLVFALGVLGLVGLQATAVKQAGQAKFRSDAALLGNELIGQLWMSDRTLAGMNAKFGSVAAGDGYKAWRDKVVSNLPGAAGNQPVVTMVAIPPLPASAPGGPVLTDSVRVTVTLKWKAPGENVGAPHQLVMVTEIK